MSEIVRQYGLACIAALVAIVLVTLISTVRITRAGEVSQKGLLKVAGFAETKGIEKDVDIPKELSDQVGEYTAKVAPPVSTAIATVGEEYKAEDLVSADTGRISVIAVNKNGVKDKVTGDVLYTKDQGGSTKQMLKFDVTGRYIIRYIITDTALGNEGATRNGTVCVAVRKKI